MESIQLKKNQFIESLCRVFHLKLRYKRIKPPIFYFVLGTIENNTLTGIFVVTALLESSCISLYTAVLRYSCLESAPPAHSFKQHLGILFLSVYKSFNSKIRKLKGLPPSIGASFQKTADSFKVLSEW